MQTPYPEKPYLEGKPKNYLEGAQTSVSVSNPTATHALLGYSRGAVNFPRSYSPSSRLVTDTLRAEFLDSLRLLKCISAAPPAF